MYSFEELTQIIEEDIAELELPLKPEKLYLPITYTLSSGGKRVRPVALLMACNLFGDNIWAARRAALAVEMFHNFTLLHDDVMDNANTRRGRDTVHKKWDSNVALLSGDVMLVYAYKLLTECATELGRGAGGAGKSVGRVWEECGKGSEETWAGAECGHGAGCGQGAEEKVAECGQGVGREWAGSGQGAEETEPECGQSEKEAVAKSGTQNESEPQHTLCKMVALIDVFNSFGVAVCEGQQYDMDFEESTEIKVEQYLKMIEGKTAALLGGALKLGALCGGASFDDAQSLYRFGVDVGLAFQLQDDILDTYADPKVFGKAVGGDIVEGKKTFLLTTSLALSQGDTRDMLLAILADNSIAPSAKIDGVKSIYDQLGVRAIAERAITDYMERALLGLDSLSVEASRLTPLKELVGSLMGREK